MSEKIAGRRAEAIGDRDPYRFQHLLNRAAWDADAVRDDLRNWVEYGLKQSNAGVGIADFRVTSYAQIE